MSKGKSKSGLTVDDERALGQARHDAMTFGMGIILINSEGELARYDPRAARLEEKGKTDGSD